MFKKILCPVDGSPNSLHAARKALDLARSGGGQLRLLHVVPVHLLDLLSNRVSMAPVDLLPRELEKRLADEGEALLAHLKEEIGAGPEVEAQQVEGVPGEVICTEAEGFDLVVVGSRGMGRLTGLLVGSVSHYVVSHAPCPVLVVRAPAEG